MQIKNVIGQPIAPDHIVRKKPCQKQYPADARQNQCFQKIPNRNSADIQLIKNHCSKKGQQKNDFLHKQESGKHRHKGQHQIPKLPTFQIGKKPIQPQHKHQNHVVVGTEILPAENDV